ncbi:MAG: hypothetical protein ACK4OO_00460 [bacterium]
MKPQWTTILLIVSWAIIGALSVALYYQWKTPPPPPVMAPEWWKLREGWKRVGGRPPMRERIFSDAEKEALRPYFETHQRMMRQMAQCLSEPQIDSSRYFTLSESLISVRGDLHRQLVRRLWENRDRIPPEKRRRLSQFLIGNHQKGYDK